MAVKTSEQLELIMYHKDLIADALLQEAANLSGLSGFSGKCDDPGFRLKRLEQKVQLLKKLAAAFRGEVGCFGENS